MSNTKHLLKLSLSFHLAALDIIKSFIILLVVISSFTLFKDIVKRNGSLRVELRLGVFDFNGWSEDKPIGKVNTVESHFEHIDHYFQAKHVFEDVLNLNSTPTDPIVKSICRPELIQVGADVLANVRLRIVYSFNHSYSQ